MAERGDSNPPVPLRAQRFSSLVETLPTCVGQCCLVLPYKTFDFKQSAWCRLNAGNISVFVSNSVSNPLKELRPVVTLIKEA